MQLKRMSFLHVVDRFSRHLMKSVSDLGDFAQLIWDGPPRPSLTFGRGTYWSSTILFKAGFHHNIVDGDSGAWPSAHHVHDEQPHVAQHVP
jgi:hypothetical protein